jgi:cellulose biosynthesis protein BcsQ
MMKILSIANSAGGVGKTTLAHCLAVSFTEFGKKTLLIDLDPAGALTFRLGFENPRTSIADFLNGSKVTDSNLVTTSERFDFIPSDSRLVANFSADALSKVISDLPKSYDVVILDLPGSLSQPLSLALSISQLVVVPVRNNLHSFRGYLQIKSISAGVEVKALAIGANHLITAVELIDEPLLESNELEAAAATKVSILTHDKGSESAESFRNVGYSILEKLGLE